MNTETPKKKVPKNFIASTNSINYYTPEEAKGKWCINGKIKCNADNCMGWIWNNLKKYRGNCGIVHNKTITRNGE